MTGEVGIEVFAAARSNIMVPAYDCGVLGTVEGTNSEGCSDDKDQRFEAIEMVDAEGFVEWHGEPGEERFSRHWP